MVSGVLSDILKPFESHMTNVEIEHWLTDLDNAMLAVYGDVSDARKVACLSTFIGDEGKTVIKKPF